MKKITPEQLELIKNGTVSFLITKGETTEGKIIPTMNMLGLEEYEMSEDQHRQLPSLGFEIVGSITGFLRK